MTACGSEPAERGPSDVGQRDPCPSCIVGEPDPADDESASEDDQPDAPPPRYVAATPRELMFYGEIDSPSVTTPRIVTVENTTTSTVLITSVYIVDQGTLLPEDGEGDAAYFSVDPDLDLSTPLRPGDTAEIEVYFEQSSHQRGALLVVETTHPAYTSLVVSLAGKIFVSW